MVNKKLIVVLIITLIALVSIGLFLFIYENRSEQEQFFNSYKLTKAELDLINDGDIILRHGFGIVSDMIGESLKEKYCISHCAIICKPHKDTMFVIHSVSSGLSDFDGMQTCSMKTFIRESKKNSIIVVRYKNIKPEDPNIISRYAKYYLEKKVCFDNLININDSSKIYCSELPYLIIKNAFNDNIFNQNDIEKLNYTKFETFWDTSRFEIIINHHL